MAKTEVTELPTVTFKDVTGFLEQAFGNVDLPPLSPSDFLDVHEALLSFATQFRDAPAPADWEKSNG